MRKVPYREYFTHTPVEQLQADATMRHEAVWPMVVSVVRKYAHNSAAIVIEGWHLRPDWVAQLNLDNVWSGWIVTSPAVLEAREKQNAAWFAASPNPEQMFKNFLSRSLWYNALILAQATAQQMKILPQGGLTSVEALCAMVLEKAGAKPAA